MWTFDPDFIAAAVAAGGVLVEVPAPEQRYLGTFRRECKPCEVTWNSADTSCWVCGVDIRPPVQGPELILP